MLIRLHGSLNFKQNIVQYQGSDVEHENGFIIAASACPAQTTP